MPCHSLALCNWSLPPGRAAEDGPGARDAFQTQVLPLLERYCIDCHSKEKPRRGSSWTSSTDQAAAVKDGQTWLRVRDALQGRIMPPADEPQPTLEELDRIVGWIENDFLAAQCGQQAGSAPVVIRRLNRQEYDNTIRDLLGLDLHLADAFPPDDIGFGYDNVGSALNISPVHVEKYLDAAEVALDKAIVPPDAEGFPPIELIGLKTYPLPPDKPVEFEHTLKPGRYLADFSLVRVGIAESVPPPAAGDRLRQGPPHRGGRPGAGRDGRLSLLARRSPRGTTSSTSRSPPARPRARTSPSRRRSPPTSAATSATAANAGCTSTRWSSAAPSRSKPEPLPESHRRILFRDARVRRRSRGSTAPAG